MGYRWLWTHTPFCREGTDPSFFVQQVRFLASRNITMHWRQWAICQISPAGLVQWMIFGLETPNKYAKPWGYGLSRIPSVNRALIEDMFYQLQHIFKPNRVRNASKCRILHVKFWSFLEFIPRTPRWEGRHVLRRNEWVGIRWALVWGWRCDRKGQVVVGCWDIRVP